MAAVPGDEQSAICEDKAECNVGFAFSSSHSKLSTKESPFVAVFMNTNRPDRCSDAPTTRLQTQIAAVFAKNPRFGRNEKRWLES